MKQYIVSIEDHFGRFHDVVEAETAGKAKYKMWLRFRDAYDYTFFEFLKITRCYLAE